MEIPEIREEKDINNERFPLSKKYRKVLLIAFLVILAIIAACILPGVIHNAVLTNRVQSYLDQKYYLYDDSVAYIFNGNTISIEWYNFEAQTSRGDIGKLLRYKVTGRIGDSEIQLHYFEDKKWKNGPYAFLHEDGRVGFVGKWKELSESDVVLMEKQISCTHQLGSETITQEPTCMLSGETSRICNKCDYALVKSISALGHDYENGTCERCGSKESVKKSDIEANTWYSYQDVLHFQNIKLHSAFSVSQGKGMMVSYYFVCQHCHVVDETLRQNVPEFNYDINKMFTCEECGGLTTVKIELG